jgi:hypothetical protein
MDNHAEGQGSGKTHTLSVLDWPTPEQLVAAHRARGEALREMTVGVFRRVKRFVAWQLRAARASQPKARSAKVRIAAGR